MEQGLKSRLAGLVVLAGLCGSVLVPVLAQDSTGPASTTNPGGSGSNSGVGPRTVPPPAETDTGGLVVHANRARRKSSGTDVWDVWMCTLKILNSSHPNAIILNPDLVFAPADIVTTLDTYIKPYMKAISYNAYQPRFRVGGTVELTNSSEGNCESTVASRYGPSSLQPSPAPEGVMIVVNVTGIGGKAAGLGTEGVCATKDLGSVCADYPDNDRYAMVVGTQVDTTGTYTKPIERRIHTVAHEIGHALSFPHSFADFSDEYDNVMDVMSRARTIEVGTLYMNLYAANWLATSRIKVHETSTPRTSHRLHANPTSGQFGLLVLPSEQNYAFATLNVRPNAGVDSGIREAGVEVYIVDQRGHRCLDRSVDGYCSGRRRRHIPHPAPILSGPNRDLAPHVYQGGDEFIIWAHEAYGLPRRGFVTPPNYEVEINRFSSGSRYFVAVTRFYGWFSDDEGNAHEADIDRIAEQRITIGCDPADLLRYCPREGTKRIQLAVFIGRTLGITPVAKPTTQTFQDIPLTWSTAGMVEALDDEGILKACSTSGTRRWYCPRAIATRLDVATFLQRALKLPLATAQGTYTDVPAADAAAVEAVVSQGIMTACSPTTFCSNHPVRRDAMATFLARSWNYLQT